MNTARAIIDVYSQTISLRANGETVSFQVDQADSSHLEHAEIYTISTGRVTSDNDTSESGPSDTYVPDDHTCLISSTEESESETEEMEDSRSEDNEMEEFEEEQEEDDPEAEEQEEDVYQSTAHHEYFPDSQHPTEEIMQLENIPINLSDDNSDAGQPIDHSCPKEKDIEMDYSQPISQIIDATQSPSDTIELPDSQNTDAPITDSDEDDVVFIDVPIDVRSIHLRASPVIPDPPLEIIQVQVVSTHEGMISALERFEDDFRMIMAVIRDSTNEYTPRQRELIEEINAEYTVYRANNSRSPQFLQNRIHAFAEDLASQLLQEHHIDETPAADELEFFEEQKVIYGKVYEALIRSAFPYSNQQMSLLHSYRYNLDYASGNPEEEVDIQMMNDLRGLMDSIADNDHIYDTSPHRFYIDCTIEHHASRFSRGSNM